jgi:hypothetical protein
METKFDILESGFFLVTGPKMFFDKREKDPCSQNRNKCLQENWTRKGKKETGLFQGTRRHVAICQGTLRHVKKW